MVSHRGCSYALGGNTGSNGNNLQLAKTLHNCVLKVYGHNCNQQCLSDEGRRLLGIDSTKGIFRFNRSLYSTANFPFGSAHNFRTNLKEIPAVDIEGNSNSIESMQKARSNFVALSCEEYIYEIGGQCSNTSATKTVERYDPASSNWTYVEEMEFERSEHAACVSDGKIYVVGGRDGDEKAVKAIESYNPDDNSWSVVGETMDELYGHNVIAF